MIDHADNIIDLNAILHPGSVYDHPKDVVADQTISIGEKRAILVSWASDAAAVSSNPALRELPGSRRLVTIDDVLSGPPPQRPAGRQTGTHEIGRAGWRGSLQTGDRTDDDDD